MNNIQHLLKESYATTRKLTGVDPRGTRGLYQILNEESHFKTYLRSLCEGLDGERRRDFIKLANNTRRALLETSMFNVNPYETLTLPILRYFYPKLIAKELVNIMPIDKPEVIKGFLKPSFKRVKSDGTGDYTGYDYTFPSVSQDISRGPNVGFLSTAYALPAVSTDIITVAGLDTTVTPVHVEKDFKIIGIMDNSTDVVTTISAITMSVDGYFSASVAHTGSGASGDTDVISGRINWETGMFDWSSHTGATKKLKYTAVIALEENSINPKIKFVIDKVRFTTVNRRISAEWTVDAEQDAKALYDISLQSEIVNAIGEQIALDIDREIIGQLISTNTTMNPSSHRATFYKTAPDNFLMGPKAWYENVLVKLNDLSAQVYNSSLMGSANTLACNPLDATLFEALNGFEYVGDSTAGGEVGYRSATVAAGKYKVLVSSLVPQGSVIVKFRSEDIAKAAYVYAPYVPSLLIPYPLGANPSLTVMTRYASQVIRNEALAVLTINAGQEA